MSLKYNKSIKTTYSNNPLLTSNNDDSVVVKSSRNNSLNKKNSDASYVQSKKMSDLQLVNTQS